MEEEAEAEPGPTGAAAADACMVRVGGWLAVGVARNLGLLTDQGLVGAWKLKSSPDELPGSGLLLLHVDVIHIRIMRV